MHKLHKLLAIALLAGLIPLFSGCKLLPGQDPLLVRAEQSIRFAYVAIDSFLKFEYDNRQQYPWLKPAADKLRDHAPFVLQQALASTKAYKKSRQKADADVLVQHLAVVETMSREAQSLSAKTSIP